MSAGNCCWLLGNREMSAGWDGISCCSRYVMSLPSVSLTVKHNASASLTVIMSHLVFSWWLSMHWYVQVLMLIIVWCCCRCHRCRWLRRWLQQVRHHHCGGGGGGHCCLVVCGNRFLSKAYHEGWWNVYKSSWLVIWRGSASLSSQSRLCMSVTDQAVKIVRNCT